MLNSRFFNKKKKWLVIISILVATALGIFLAPPAFGKQNKGKVIFLVLNSISLDDLTAAEAPNLKPVIDLGAVGLMNAKAASIKEVANFYLSIGAGARAEAGELGNLGFNATEKLPKTLYNGMLTAKDLSFQGNDIIIPNSAVVNLGINDASGRSYKYHNNITPGLLGEALKKAGKKTAVVGNADTLQDTHREISLITMDLQGKTSLGNVASNLNVLDKSFPGAVRSDYKKLAYQTVSFLEKADFVAVELGDSARIDYQRPLLTKRLSIQRRKEAILRADQFLASLRKQIDLTKNLLIIASPKPHTDSMKDLNYLTPIVINGLDSSKRRALLTSDTTKRAGLVANIDLAPTILNYFEIEVPAEMAGNIINPQTAKSPLDFLAKRHDQIYTMRVVRTPFVITYALLLLIGLTLVVLTLRWRSLGRKINARGIEALKIFLLFMLAVPLSTLLQIPLNKDNIALSLISGFAIAIFFSLAGYWFFRKKALPSLLLITVITSLVIVIDSLTGTNLSQRSFFGSDMISGGRYYGLGNVYMGVLIGASTFSLAGLADTKVLKKYLSSIGFFGLLTVGIVVGHPRIGANVGGLITGLGAALIFSQVVADRRFSWKLFSINILVFGLLMAVILSADLPGLPGQSHAGKALAIIDTRGSQAVTDIIIRKVSQNARGTLSFPGFLALMLVALAVALKNWSLRIKTSLLELFKNDAPVVSKAFLALFWAAIIGYVFNDTGAVTAAAIASYILIPLFYLTLENTKLSAN